MREMLKHRHQVGEAFMKTEHVRAGRNREVRAEPVEQRMREFVRDDVMRKAREYPALRRIASRALRGFEIAERKAKNPDVVAWRRKKESLRDPDLAARKEPRWWRSRRCNSALSNRARISSGDA